MVCPPGHLTPREVAERFGASVRWVYDQVERGLLRPKLRRGYERGMVFEAAEVERYAMEEWRTV